MTGPVAFLEAAHNQAELAAQKAAEVCGCHPPVPRWSFRDGDEPGDGRILLVGDPHSDLKRKIGRRWNGSYEGLFMAEHIVLHDPHSVLRRVAAEREILNLHRPDDDDRPECITCGPRWPCRTVVALAEGWESAEEEQ